MSKIFNYQFSSVRSSVRFISIKKTKENPNQNKKTNLIKNKLDIVFIVILGSV